MFAIPTALRAQFEEHLLEKAIPKKTHWFFIKWLRYYLDFCEKYDFPDAKKDSLASFLRKLQEKKRRMLPMDHVKPPINRTKIMDMLNRIVPKVTQCPIHSFW